MTKKAHDMYDNQEIRDFITEHVHHLTLKDLRQRLVTEFPRVKIASRSSLGRHIKEKYSDQPRFTRRHVFFRNDEIRNFVNEMSKKQLSIDQIRIALTTRYPERKPPGRSALQRYLVTVGRAGHCNNWLQYPAAQTFLRKADPSLSIKQLEEGLAQVLPADKAPGRSAISRYFSGTGGKTQRASFFTQPVCSIIIGLVCDGCTVAEIGNRLASIFPDVKTPAHSTLARHVKELRERLKQAKAA